jgi:hypothetical protein
MKTNTKNKFAIILFQLLVVTLFSIKAYHTFHRQNFNNKTLQPAKIAATLFSHAKQIIITNHWGMFSLFKGVSHWESSDRDLIVLSSQIENLFNEINSINVIETIASSKENIVKYNLVNPISSIRTVDVNGRSETYHLGLIDSTSGEAYLLDENRQLIIKTNRTNFLFSIANLGDLSTQPFRELTSKNEKSNLDITQK